MKLHRGIRLLLILSFCLCSSGCHDSALRTTQLRTATAEAALAASVGGRAHAVAVQGSYAYVAARLRLLVLDVSNPAKPVRVGQSALFPNVVQDLALAGNYAYVADGEGGLRIIDIANPAAPAEVGFYDTPGSARGVAVAGDTIYVADVGGGLDILRLLSIRTFLPLLRK